MRTDPAESLEKLSGRDWRFLFVCLALIAGGAAVTAALYSRAFPEASIDFRVTRPEARRIAERFLESRHRPIAGTHFAARFDVEEDSKVYLERELGLEQASRFYGREAKVWRWGMRWFRSGEKPEERVSISPTGDLVSWESVRREDAPGPSLSREAARALASAFLATRGLDVHTLTPIEAFPTSRPHRTDWSFVDERAGFRMKDATVRYQTLVAGGEVAGFEEFVHVPETWQRGYKALRSKNEAAGQAATFGFLVIVLAMLGVLISRITRKDVRWGLVSGFGLAGFVLALLSMLNNLPLTLYEYDTASPLSSHLASQIVLGILGAIAVGAGIACVIAAAEPPYREQFRSQMSISAIFSFRGLRSRRFLRGVLLGYALVAFFCAYQAVFYVVAAHLGAWAPADVNYSDMLSTAFPWATVLLIGFLPAVSEEGIFRVFSISFLERLGAGRFIAIVVPAFIWGFGHSAYPNQPFFIRGVEVGCAGVVMGLVLIRFGVLPLLVWHFTVDALYTALVMLRSHDTYFVVSGGIAAGILLVPLLAATVLALRSGGFVSEAGLTNADAGSAPALPVVISVAEPASPVRALRTRTYAAAAVAAAILLGGWLLPSPPRQPTEDRIGRARADAIASAFLKANGVDAARFRTVSYGGTGFADDAEVRDAAPAVNGGMSPFSDAAARYVIGRGGPGAFGRLGESNLPLNFWVTRFFLPGVKEEWKVFVDPRRARVIGFLNPREEAAPGGAAPSEARARERASAAAAALGYPAARYGVLEVGTQERPKRVDTTVVLESRASAVAEAAPRLTAVFEGSRLSAFYPSIHVPESFLERDRRRSALDWLLLGARIVALGSLIGFAIILFLRTVRRPEFQWRALVRPLLPISVLAAAALASRFSGLMRQYPTAIALSTFEFSMGLSLLILWLLILCGAGIAFVFFSGARPGWRFALARQGSLGDAALRAVIAAGGLLGLRRWSEVSAWAVPALFHPDPSLPGVLDRALPPLAILSGAAIGTFALATAASAVAMGSRTTMFRRIPVRIALGAAAAIALLPSAAHSAAELVGTFAGTLLLVLWLMVCAFTLLRDHVAAWVLFGAIVYGGSSAARLIAEPAASDRTFGELGLLFVAAAVVALVGLRRREPAVRPAPAGESMA